LNRKYHFAFFTIVNEILIAKDHRMNAYCPAYRQMQARDKIDDQ